MGACSAKCCAKEEKPQPQQPKPERKPQQPKGPEAPPGYPKPPQDIQQDVYNRRDHKTVKDEIDRQNAKYRTKAQGHQANPDKCKHSSLDY